MRWRLFVYRLGAEPSRHRVAVWRELRRVGALSLQPATWAIPVGEGFDEALERALELAERADATALVVDAVPLKRFEGVLERLFTDEREAEWVEFRSECDKYIAEIDHEFAIAKFTLAELGEEEQSLDRLRRWYREQRAKDLFGAPSATDAEVQLKACAERLEEFALRVFQEREGPDR